MANFELPVSQAIQRQGEVERIPFRLDQQPVDRELGTGQVVQLLRLNLGEHQHPGKIAREARQLSANLGHGLEVFPLFTTGFGNGVKRLRHDFLLAAVEQARQRPAEKAGDIAAPGYAQDDPARSTSNHDDECGAVIQIQASCRCGDPPARDPPRDTDHHGGDEPLGNQTPRVIAFLEPAPENPADNSRA